MDLQFSKMIEVAAKPYRAIGQAGESTLLVADARTEPQVVEAFFAAARSLDLVPIVTLMPELERDYQDPPEAVEKAAEAADIVHYLTSTGLVHSQFGYRMSAMRKKRIISEGITTRMLIEGAALAEPQEIRAASERVADVWDNGNQVHVTTRRGTDFTVSVEGRRCFSSYSRTGGKIGALGGAPRVQFPGGECPVPPLEDTGEGIIVVDVSIHQPEGFLREPIRIELKHGRIDGISGGEQADIFAQWLKRYGDSESDRLCELAIGTNPRAVFMGLPRQDRYILGSFHVGFGMNKDVGGVVDSNLHFDAIFSQPTVEVDGKTVVRDGHITV